MYTNNGEMLELFYTSIIVCKILTHLFVFFAVNQITFY